MRVVINGLHAKSGGGVTYLRNVLPNLAEMPGLEFHLFLHKDQFHLFYPVHENIRVTLFNFRPSFFRTLIWEQISIPILAWGLGADVVFSPANYGPLLARNHVIMLRNAVSVIQLARRPGAFMYWLALSGATFLSLLTAKKAVVVSNYAKKLLTFGLFKNLRNKCTVVYHGTRQIEPTQVARVQNGTDLLAVSDVYIQKNYHVLLQAHAILIKKHPELHLTIVGREIDRAYTESLHELSRELGLDQNVTFKGHVETEELMRLYRGCRAFVFPSVVETFGNPLLEAMIVGAPIASSNTAAMPEVLGDCGVFFDPNDKQNMADQIEKLLSDDALCARLGEKAMRRARTFLWSRTAQQTCSVLMSAAEPIPETPRRVR